MFIQTKSLKNKNIYVSLDCLKVTTVILFFFKL